MDRAAVDAFYQAALAAGAKDNGAPGIPFSIIIRTITSAFVLDPTATTSRRSVTRLRESVMVAKSE